jgi:hypothetical protein
MTGVLTGQTSSSWAWPSRYRLPKIHRSASDSLWYQVLPADAFQMRSFAAVLFRRTASKSKKSPSGESKEMFLLLNLDARNVIRSKLLECLATEQINHVRNKISDAIAEIARQYTDNGMWTLCLEGHY